MKLHRFFLSVVILIAVLWPAAVAAQDTVAPQQPCRVRHWSFGLTAGLDRNYHSIDMVYMTDMRYDKYSTGSVFGIQLGYAPVKWLSINTGAVLIQKNYHMDHVFEYYYLRYSLPTTTTNQYVNVPLELNLSVGRAVRLHVFGGGYGGYWLKSHRKGTTYSFSNNRLTDFDEDIEFNDKRDNRIEYGVTWGGGLSTRIIDRIEIGAELRWYYAVTDIQKSYMRNLNPRYNTTVALQFGVGYWF